MGPLDLLILFVFFAVLLAIGAYARRRQQGTEDFFVAGRSRGALTIACLWMAAWVGGAAVIGSSSRAFSLGITAGWYVGAQMIGCVLFGLFMAARVKRIGDTHMHLTYPDFIEQSYDSRTRIVATVSTLLANIAYTAGQFVAAAAILQALLGWSYVNSLLLSGAIVSAYTAMGGYLAVTYTDWLKVTILFLGVVVVGMPIAIGQAGGPAELRAALPDSYFDLGALGWERVAALVVSIVLSFFVAMDSFSRSFAARDEAAARNGALLAVLLIAPFVIAPVWLGLSCAVSCAPGTEANGMLATFILQAFPAGLKGLIVIGVLSAVMSCADICIVTASANYTRDIHQRYLQPGVTPEAMLRIGSLASLGTGALALLLAWRMRDIIDILQLGFTINAAALVIPTIAAVYALRIPAGAAFWSASLSLATVIVWYLAQKLQLGSLFALDPLWPGLAVSAIVLLVFARLGRVNPGNPVATPSRPEGRPTGF